MKTNRDKFLAIINGEGNASVPYFPDISDWYVYNRTVPGEIPKYGPGELVPDEDTEFHKMYCGNTMPSEFADWNYLDFYRNFNWGIPVHLYDWYHLEYEDVKQTIDIMGNKKIIRWSSPEGCLQKVMAKAEDGSWCPVEFPVKTITDLRLWAKMSSRGYYSPRYDRISETLSAAPNDLVLDLVIPRSPYGKLVHELVGFEELVYWLFDNPSAIIEFLEEQSQRDIALIELAAQAPLAQVVIMSDHSDQNLISPVDYQKYCIPFYRKIADLLHKSGKKLSSHLDGNFKGYMPMLSETKFDILDGCTPFPMSNYKVYELVDVVVKNNICSWCGVPSTMICQNLPDTNVLQAGEEILNAFAGTGRLIFNIGDIVSPKANIYQVIALGELIK